ncbi:MAG: ATP-binding protein [Alphaproteobacteria bacterium]
MLLRFGVENHRSIKGYQELSFMASRAIKDSPDPLRELPGIKGHVLPVAALYGANASGKTSVVRALVYFQEAVLYSHRRGEPGSPILTNPFLLDEKFTSTPTRMNCDFVHDGVRYHFGFKLTSREIVEEWLYAYPNGRQQIWYHLKAGEPPVLGAALGRRRKDLYGKRPNSLFLSAAAQNNHEKLGMIIDYFRSWPSVYIGKSEAIQRKLGRMIADDAGKARLLDIIRAADIGVIDVDARKIVVDMSESAGEIEKIEQLDREEFDNYAIIISNGDEIYRDGEGKAAVHSIVFKHTSSDGSDVTFPWRNESHGTHRYIYIAVPVLQALDTGSPIIVDELDSSLHPLLSRKIVELFNNPRTNPKGAQLLFTTHDSSLLSRNLLRRDQIWFTEKDRGGATHLYPLTDIATRAHDNLEKGYLDGRFGAIPYVRPVDDWFNRKVDP